ncbi:type VI secretion system baseplate subunit TssE [Sulfitobacter sp. F26204]|uniref:type VI secretion system baseplate subunit TssE n=1 Tax=Sulfitobacter sp. F26204 TaxID=2996014 RepID=UPI00225E6229|nr:type VI secretion system baseplate subunit TssE [Sulfitobacter sp. F26204]MCX7561634.1 type VI secretion system baseplate subunit TssE [Sulfitobacter sp. F26204]
MQNPPFDKRLPTQRIWRKGERAKVSILQVFRNSYDAGDALGNTADAQGGPRSLQRRDGLDEATLRKYLQIDLNALLNTVELGSAIDLTDVPHVAASIANYGFGDLSNVSAAEINSPGIKQAIRNSLVNHEPRLVRESIEIEVVEPEGDNRQRLSISVTAELMGDPIDIPLNFDAEVDMGAGKLKMSRLRIHA